MAQYFFYKNVACYTNQLFYAFHSNFSSQSLFDGPNLAGFNILFSSLPIFVFAIMAQNIKSDKLMKHPQLYKRASGNKLLAPVEILSWFLFGVWHSFTIFYGWFVYWNRVNNNSMAQKCFGLCVYTSMLIVVNLKLMIHTRSINFLLVMSVIMSMILFFIINIVYNTFIVDTGLLNTFGNDYNTSIASEAPLDSK